jgi:hypothetical protein
MKASCHPERSEDSAFAFHRGIHPNNTMCPNMNRFMIHGWDSRVPILAPGIARTSICRCKLFAMPRGLVRYFHTGNFHFIASGCSCRSWQLGTPEERTCRGPRLPRCPNARHPGIWPGTPSLLSFIEQGWDSKNPNNPTVEIRNYRVGDHATGTCF